MTIKTGIERARLEAAERAADRYDGLGAPMNAYRPHVAELRRKVLGPVADPMLRAQRETQGVHSATCECPTCWQEMERG